MANELIFGVDARKEIAKGIKILADSVKVTLGPRGKNVIIEQEFGSPLIINDGVTIAKNIVLENQYQNLGASLIIEAASKTNDIAGDGTTTAVILSSSCILNGLKFLDNGVNPVEIKEGFDYYLPIIIDKIKARSEAIKSFDDLEEVAALSSGSNMIGKLISDAYRAVGADGEVTVEESHRLETYLDVVKGYSYDRGFASSYMANNEEKQIAELINPDILVTDKKLTSMKEIMPFLENAMKSGNPLLIICDDIEQEVLSAIVMNKLRGVFNVVVTKAPSFGDRKIQLLKDIALITGATFVSTTKGDDLSNISLEGLGKCAKAIINQNKTVIIDGAQEKDVVLSYAEGLKVLLENETITYEKEKYRERIAKILGGVALIKVGAPTEVELHDKKLRIEDALCATKAAFVSGTIEGGGKVLYEISEELKSYNDFVAARDIIIESFKAPFNQILENAGVTKEDIINDINSNYWFDAKTKKIVNLRENGIIDPTNVAISGVTNALSIAGIVLTTECAIISKKEKKVVNEENLI